MLQAAFGGDVGPQGELYTSVYSIDGVSFGVIFASELVKSYTLTPQAAGLDVTRQWRMFAMDSKQAPVTFAADHALTLDKCANTSVCVHYASPAIQTRSVPNYTT